MEVSHGARVGTHVADLLNQSLANGFQASCNGGYGLSAQTGFILFVWGTAVANGFDYYAFNAGIAASYLSSVGSISPEWNTEGNLNSISIYYG
jgi:hypothetical protein